MQAILVVFGGRILEKGMTKYQEYPAKVLWLTGWGVFAVAIVISAIVGVIYNKRVAQGVKGGMGDDAEGQWGHL